MKWVWISAVVFFALWTAGWAHAANLPNPVLDAIASEVAQKPVSVHCEQSEPEWRQMVAAVAPNAEASLVIAYTLPGTSIAYLSPRACRALTVALRGTVEDGGYSEFSLALLALAHESVHQRGVVNEAETECLAMPLVKSLSIKYFKVKVRVYKYVKSIRGKPYGTGEQYYKRVSVVNPVFTKLKFWVDYWHKQKPLSYQGGC